MYPNGMHFYEEPLRNSTRRQWTGNEIQKLVQDIWRNEVQTERYSSLGKKQKRLKKYVWLR